MRLVLVVLAWLVGVAGVLMGAFVAAMRRKVPVVQGAVRRMNRAFMNPRQLRDAGQPGAYASVVRHVGRRSGTEYRTPVVVLTTDIGHLVALPYGPGADWVRNVLAAGGATIEHEGEVFEVDRPEIIDDTRANPYFPASDQRQHRLFGVRDFLLVHPRDQAGTTP